MIDLKENSKAREWFNFLQASIAGSIEGESRF
jgi:hypothetical protein